MAETESVTESVLNLHAPVLLSDASLILKLRYTVIFHSFDAA